MHFLKEEVDLNEIMSHYPLELFPHSVIKENMRPIFPLLAFWCQKWISHDNQQHQGPAFSPDDIIVRHTQQKNPPPLSETALNFLLAPSIHCAPPDCVYTELRSFVLVVAAKFRRPALNFTLVAQRYLCVIHHVHLCVCGSKILHKVKQKPEISGGEKRRIDGAVCC